MDGPRSKHTCFCLILISTVQCTLTAVWFKVAILRLLWLQAWFELIFHCSRFNIASTLLWLEAADNSVLKSVYNVLPASSLQVQRLLLLFGLIAELPPNGRSPRGTAIKLFYCGRDSSLHLCLWIPEAYPADFKIPIKTRDARTVWVDAQHKERMNDLWFWRTCQNLRRSWCVIYVTEIGN